MVWCRTGNPRKFIVLKFDSSMAKKSFAFVYNGYFFDLVLATVLGDPLDTATDLFSKRKSGLSPKEVYQPLVSRIILTDIMALCLLDKDS